MGRELLSHLNGSRSFYKPFRATRMPLRWPLARLPNRMITPAGRQLALTRLRILFQNIEDLLGEAGFEIAEKLKTSVVNRMLEEPILGPTQVGIAA